MKNYLHHLLGIAVLTAIFCTQVSAQALKADTIFLKNTICSASLPYVYAGHNLFKADYYKFVFIIENFRECVILRQYMLYGKDITSICIIYGRRYGCTQKSEKNDQNPDRTMVTWGSSSLWSFIILLIWPSSICSKRPGRKNFISLTVPWTVISPLWRSLWCLTCFGSSI